jgi:hypothetical protein
MKKLALAIIVVVIFFIASCSTTEHKKWDRDWEGPIISPLPDGHHDSMTR